jgi:predicted ATPase/DNA-binding winged helix-turn-helix (wHTH) protein
MRSTASGPAERGLAFGRFVLVPTQQLLLESGKPVQLGARALDILTALVERAGDLVTKEELVAHAWPDTVVHEGNLKVHIAAIRRVLADGQSDQRFVVNVAGRGYRFVAAVSACEPIPASASARLSASSARPAVLNRVFGRDDVIDAIAVLLSECRFVTIVGPGGIGKTTVAQAITAAAVSTEDAPIFVDLAPLSDPLLLPSSIAALLGVAVPAGNPLPHLLQFLRDKQILIVLDSCEHLLEAVASLAESLLASALGLRLLVTSREPLRASAEVVRRLPPLAIPPESETLSAAEAETFSAVALFVERARAGSGAFTLGDADVPQVTEICRRLDGNALAIELAAGRVDAFGIGGVAERLVDRFNLLKGGRRTALPRHQGLGATLDWSYGLLPDTERAVLRRLSVFVGPFTLEAAGAVAADANMTAADVAYCVANLVAKSLVSVETNAHSRYRLLDTTSAYARELLERSNQQHEYAARHAHYLCELLERASAELLQQDALTWVSIYGRQVDNLRRALDWSFSEHGNGTLGIALTIAAVPLWLNLSLMDECQQRVRNALRQVAGSGEQAPLREMQLYSALGVTLYSMGSRTESKAAWLNTLSRAERLQNSDFRLRAVWGLWTVCITGSEHSTGLALAREFGSVAEEASDTHARLVSERLIGTSHYFLGEQAAARNHLERMLVCCTAESSKADVVRFQFDQETASRSYLSRVLWLQGYPDQAASWTERGLIDVLQLGHSQSICYSVGSSGCPIAFYNGDLANAERNVELLLEHSAKCRLALWATMGRGFKGMLLSQRGDFSRGSALLRQAIDELHAAGFVVYRTVFLGELAQASCSAGQSKLGLEAIAEALLLTRQSHEHWYPPELLRIQAELLLLEAAPGASARAEACLRQSLELARRQDVLSWQLRTAMSLTRLQSRQDRAGDARELLQEVFSRFSEGFTTADLRAAKRLLGAHS